MKFNEKLQKLRKENKMSQEQLADLLDVSRQAVSKWESGTTYPEMDKLLMLCKIFKCTLEELTNDDISEITIEEKEGKKNWWQNILGYIEKTIYMLKDMSFHDILQMIIRMAIVFIILGICSIPVFLLFELGKSVFFTLGNNMGKTLSSLWQFLLGVAYLGISITAFLYAFKVQYLDHYIKKEKEEKTEEEEKEETTIIHKNLPQIPFFPMIGKLCTLLFKTIIFFITIPFLFTFTVLFIVLVLIVYLFFQKIYYFGFLFLTIFSILGLFVIIQFLAQILFEKKIHFSSMFKLFIISIIGIGSSIGICIFEIADTTYKNELPNNIKLATIREEIPFQEDLKLIPHYRNNISYIVNETIKEVVVEVIYKEDFQKPTIHTTIDNEIFIYSDIESPFRSLKNLIIKNLKDKEFYNYDLLYDVEINIYANKNNLQILKDNLKKEEMDTKICDEENIMEENRILYENLSQLEAKLQELENHNNQLTEELNYYKNTLQNLIQN